MPTVRKVFWVGLLLVVLACPLQAQEAQYFGKTYVEGKQKHDAVDGGGPLKIGGKASATEPTAVAQGDRVDAWFDLSGRQVVTGNLTFKHAVTSLADGVTTVGTAGTDVVLGDSQEILWVCVQSQTDNTGLIAVGGLGVDATEATGTGLILYPSDKVCLEVDNIDDVFIDSTVSGEGVRFFSGR